MENNKNGEAKVQRDFIAPLKEKGKLTLAPKSPMTSKQILQIMQKTPKNHIYKRKGRGGQEFEYVTGTYMKKVLNFTFGWLWNFQIIDKGREGNLVWVQGRLTISNTKLQPIIVKEQFGRADIKFLKDKPTQPVDYGNDLKAAATDALKKCASELGIASDVYGKQEFKEIDISKNAGFVEESTKKVETPKVQTFKCSQVKCVLPVSKSEHDYSLQFFKRSLCRDHQKEAKK